MKKRVLSMFMALVLCLTLLPAPAWAAETDAPEGGAIVQEEQQEALAAESPAISEQAAENGIAVQDGGLVPSVSGNAPAECICETHCEQEVINSDCPICSAEDADLSACKGTEQAISLMAAAADHETISGNVTWENRNITTPVTVKGDTTITLKGENTITITETAYDAALDMYYANLTIQGSGSLTVTVPDRKYGIADGNWSDTAGGTLTIKDGVKITTNGGQRGLSAKAIVIENGTLNLNSGWGIGTASLTMNGGTLYATGKYGAISNSRYGNARNIDSNLTVLYSDEQNANTDDMSVGTAADTTREGDVKTIYIAKMAPRAGLIVGAQQGTLQESLGSQTATFSVTGINVKINTLNVEWVGEHTGLTAEKSADNQTITVTADNNVKEGRYKLKLTADSEAGYSPNKATATATVTVAAAPRNPITINKQTEVVYEKLGGESVAVVDVNASLESGQSGKITYQWYVNGKEFTGTGSGSYKIILTQSDLTPVEGRNWEYSGQVYCKLSYNDYTVDTKTVTVTINTCTHAKYTHDGKCQQCGEPCRAEVLFISEAGIPYSFERNNDGSQVGGFLVSGGTFYFVRDTDVILRAGTSGGDETNKKDVTLDLQGHKVEALDLQNFPYNSVTIKNGTIGGIEAEAPAVLILDSVTTDANHFSNRCTMTVKGGCVFDSQVKFFGKTQLQGGTFQNGIVETYAPVLALLADGYAFADADSNDILNISDVNIKDRKVKVVEHTCQYHNGKCVCGRSCDHAGKVDKDGYCTFCKALVEAFETGGKRYTSLENALAAAQDDDTITLRGPLTIENVEPIEISKNIVLNLNGFTLSKSAENALLRILGSNVAITNGKVQSTCTSKPAVAVEVGKFDHTGAKLTLDNVTLEGSTDGGTGSHGNGLFILTGNEAVVTSGTFPSGIYTQGALTMSGGSAAWLELGALNGIQVTLSGGSFDSIKIGNRADYQSLLAGGYAYLKQGGILLKLSEMNENTAVTVVKCSHPSGHSAGTICPYCGCAAEVTKPDGSISYHRTAGEAIAAADGGTVKLLANAGEITIGSPLKLNLNGKTAAKLTVTGDVTLASLLPEGYAFKSGSTWITDLTGKELTHVSMARIPIKSMDYETKMSMTYGGAGTLLVKVTKEIGTGAVSFQWYKVEDGKETAVGSATTKNQFDLSALKLSAGQHTFRFSATCDGYVKMSKDIVVMVQKATPIVVTVPTVAEREYNPDAALTGSDMTGGSVTGADGNELAGTWSFTGTNIVPTVNDKGYQAVFTPNDTNNYNTVTRTITVKVTKATPVIAENPTATALTYGQKLSDSSLTGGKVTYKTADGTEVSGAFAWKNSNIKPTAADSGRTEYDVIFTPSDTDNYNAVDIKLTITVNKAALAALSGESRSYFYADGSNDKAETMDIAGKLPADRGNTTFTLAAEDADGLLSDVAVDTAGKLSYKVKQISADKADKSATITVTASMENYEDAVYTMTIKITDKMLVTLKSGNTVSVNGSNALTYGEKVSKLTLGNTVFVEAGTDDEIEGILSWSNPDEIPAAGTTQAGWVFKPADSRHYAELTGTAAITVAKATPTVVTVPTVAERKYNPDVVLTDSDMTGGSVTGADGNSLAGTWSFAGTNIIPTVNNKGYQAVFTPDDPNNYNTVTRTITVKVTKATPVIAEKPTAGALIYGQTLSDSTLTGGKATYKTADGTEVAGTFVWKNGTLKPAAVDSQKTEYDATFTPSDTANYNAVGIKLRLTVNKAAKAPNMPEAAMAPAHSTKKVGDIILPEGWSWQEADKDTVLADGVAVTATAVYTGADKGNYETESVSITITRSECDHTHTEIRNQREATCTQTGYTGDTYCTDCDKLLSTGKELAALGHDYKATVTKQPTTTEEGVRTYTCTRCNSSYTESIAKLPEEQHTHNYTGSIMKEATCTEAGARTYTCSCGDSYTENIPATGHSYVSKVTKAATTTEEGIMTYSCSKCGHSYTQPIAKLESDDSSKDNGSQNQKPQPGTDNGNQNQEPQPDTGNGKDNGTSIKPYIKDDSGKEGWDVIKPQLEEAKPGDTVTVAMNGTTVVPKDVIDSIKGKDTTLVLDMGNGLSWKVYGKDITGAAGDIDFGVTVGADAGKSIPVDVINNVTGERYSINLTLAYDGELGFKATLTVNMESKNAGLYANLFYYNEQTGELEFICAGQIDSDGNVELEFTHASDYTIVVDTRIMSDNGQADNKADETIPAPKTDYSTSKYAWNNTIIIIIGICIILIVFGAVFYVRKKSGSEEK